MTSKQVVTHEDCLKMVSQCLGTPITELKILNVTTGPLGSGTTGFMGEHLRIKVSIVLNSTGCKKDVHFFAKVVPSVVAVHREYVLSLQAYEKEATVYIKILPQLKKCLQQRPGASELRNHWPECYLTKPDLIVLEDLVEQGFILHNNIQCMDYEHIVLVLKTFASLHAASLIFEEQQSMESGTLCSIKDMYQEFFYENLYTTIEGSPGFKWFMNGIKTATHIAEFLPKYGKDSQYFYVVKDKLPKTCKRVWKLVESSKKYRNVLCHGDLWTNNLLFKYVGNKPVDVRFVDFQMVRYSPPATDLAFFLYLVTRRSFREQHEESLLKLYHDALVTELQLSGLHAELLLPWTELKESYDRMKEFGRISAAVCFQLSLMPGEYIAPIITSPHRFTQLLMNDRSKEVHENFTSNSIYRERLTEALEELIEFCVLKHH